MWVPRGTWLESESFDILRCVEKSKDQKLCPRAVEPLVSLGRFNIHERARWTSMCCQENGLTYSRLVVQSDDLFIFISCRCWFNRDFTSNCAEVSSRFLTTVDAYTPTERVFALLCLRFSGLSIRCFFFFVLHEGCLNLFHRGLCSPIFFFNVSAYPFYFVEVCVVLLHVFFL